MAPFQPCVPGCFYHPDTTASMPQAPVVFLSIALGFTELRCKGKGEWNVSDVVCADGTVKLAINGRFVNSIRDSSVRKGYLCLEAA
jgi:hypothetical protein